MTAAENGLMGVEISAPVTAAQLRRWLMVRTQFASDYLPSVTLQIRRGSDINGFANGALDFDSAFVKFCGFRDKSRLVGFVLFLGIVIFGGQVFVHLASFREKKVNPDSCCHPVDSLSGPELSKIRPVGLFPLFVTP
jgi:hypothetical protein